jgi:hypothetical protein
MVEGGVEVIAMFSNPSDQGERLRQLVEVASRRPKGVRVQTTRRVSSRHLRVPQVREIVAEYLAGSTVYELSEQFAIRRQRVSTILKREGVQVRRPVFTQEEITTAKDLYSLGYSCQAIANQLGRNHGTIWRALTKMGTKMRDTHGRDR